MTLGQDGRFTSEDHKVVRFYYDSTRFSESIYRSVLFEKNKVRLFMISNVKKQAHKLVIAYICHFARYGHISSEKIYVSLITMKYQI